MASTMSSPKRQRSTGVRWTDFPLEIWQLFASFLDLYDLARLAQTHRRGLRCAIQAMPQLRALHVSHGCGLDDMHSMYTTVSRLLGLEKISLTIECPATVTALLSFIPNPDRLRCVHHDNPKLYDFYQLFRFPRLEKLRLTSPDLPTDTSPHFMYQSIDKLSSISDLHVRAESWVPTLRRPLRALSLPSARFPSNAAFRAFWAQQSDLEELTLRDMPTFFAVDGGDLSVMHRMRILMLQFFATLGPPHLHLSNVKALARLMPQLRVFHVQHWMCYTFQRFVEEGRDLERLMELEQLVIENCYFRSMLDQPVYMTADEMLPLMRALSPRLQVLVMPRECFCVHEALDFIPPLTPVNPHTRSVGLHINNFNETAGTKWAVASAQEQWLKDCFPHAQFQWWWRDVRGRLHSVSTASDLPTSEAEFKNGPEHTLARHPPYSKPFYS